MWFYYLSLPDSSGLDTLAKVHSKAQQVAIIILTGLSDEDLALEAVRKGAQDYLVKGQIDENLLSRAIIYAIERNRVGEALKESEERYRTLFENASEAIVVAQDGVIKFANPKGEELYGYPQEELASRPLTYFIHEEDREIVGERHKRRLRGEAPPSTYPFRIINKAGDIKWVELNVSPFSWDDRPATLCFLTDLTERNKAQEEKKKIETQLLQSEKMASIGQLAAGVAHEINNPTGFVSSNLKTLSDYQNDMFGLIREYRKLTADLKETTATAEYPGSIPEQMERIVALESEVDIDYILDDIPNLIKESQEGTERIKKIVIGLKDFAHPGEQKLQYADINRNLDSTLNVVWNELKYKTKVIKDYGDLPEVQCYPQQINQVFMNLLVNAAQAIEKKGEIKIATRALDGQVEIKIGDTGSGISKEDLSKIFDPFFTTKDVGKGTGLGLNVAYNIIKKHKGSIDVESELGRGATFIIRLQVDLDLESNQKGDKEVNHG
jgi:PAS domain S-box-containing protein